MAASLLKSLIRFYQKFIGPLLGNHCRFHPSCSQYGVDALTNHGFFKGVWLSSYRILRCGPWSQGGFDPVPEKQRQN